MKENVLRGIYAITLLLTVSSAFAATATQDGFTITAPDVLCTGTTCLVPVIICNIQNTSVPFNITFVVDKVTPSALSVLEQQEQIIQVAQPSSGSYVENESNSSDVTYSYINQTLTTAVWENIEFTKETQYENSNELTSDGADPKFVLRNRIEAPETAFEVYECKEFTVNVKNVIGGVWKYDVNFLDPLINSSQYEVGNVSDNSSNWGVDMDGSASLVRLSSDNKSFMLNYSVLYSIQEDIAPDPNTQAQPSDGNNRHAQNFSLSSIATISQIRVGLYKSGGPTNGFTFRIETASGSNPSGSLVCSGAKASLSPSSISSGYSTVNLTLESPCVLSANTQYFVHYTPSYVDSGNFVSWRVDTTPPYTKGTRFTWDGAAWSTTDQDFMVALYAENVSEYNVSANFYLSRPISLVQDIVAFNPVWSYIANGGSITINATCNADDSSPSWTELSNDTVTYCSVSGDSLAYKIGLVGNTTDSPVMQNLTINFDLHANETLGRAAILGGVVTSPIGNSYLAYADQQVYIRLSNNTQALSTFDYFIVAGNKRYAFNYDENSAVSFPSFYNISPVFYVWQRHNLSTTDISSDIDQLITSTY